MIRKFLACAILLLPLSCSYQPAMAQTCPTRPSGDNSNACASTAFVHGALPVVPSSANPTASVGNTVVNGTATTYMRSDAAPPLGAGAAATNIGTLGGDLSGTLPNPTVAAVQGKAFQNTAYTNGQVPVWNTVNNRFQPGSSGGASGIPWTDVTNNSVANLSGDGNMVRDAVCNATTTLTSATANFTSGDIGKVLEVDGCGAASGTLLTTISSVTNSTTIIMGAAASVSGTAKVAAYGTDNTTALNTLIASIASNNSVTLYFPIGNYFFTGQVTFTGKRLTFLGAAYAQSSGFNGAVSFPGAASLIGYLGTGSGNFLYAGSGTTGVKFENFAFTWFSSSYTGNFLSYTNDTGSDPGYLTVVNNTFNPTATLSTATDIYISKSINSKILGNTFFGGGTQIAGGTGAGGYLNGIVIQGNTFAFYNTVALAGSFSAAVVSGNVFEQSTANVGKAWIDSSAVPSGGISWTSNWFGDSTSAVGGTAWIVSYGWGISITANFFGGVQQNLVIFNSTKGISITGNLINGTYNSAINYGTATVDGGIISGNTYHGVTSFEANTGNKGTNMTVTSNVAF